MKTSFQRYRALTADGEQAGKQQGAVDGLWIPFGAELIKLEPSGSLHMEFDQDLRQAAGTMVFRFAAAFDDREYKLIRLKTGSHEIAQVEVWCSYPCQPFECVLNTDDARLGSRLSQHGVELEMHRGELPLWILAACDAVPDELQPQIMSITAVEGAPAEPLQDAFAQAFSFCSSSASLQRFGWMESCVLDGVTAAGQVFPEHECATRAALDRHWGFFSQDTDLVYGDDFSRVRKNQIYGIETVGPYGSSGYLPGETAGEHLLPAFVDERKKQFGSVRDQVGISTEGMLFLAYPLIAQGVKYGRNDLVETGVTELLTRADALCEQDSFCQLQSPEGTRHFGNWSRGVAWYLLGLARSAQVLPETYHAEHAQIELFLENACRLVRRSRRPDGVWPGFLDKPDSAPDTAGSAGIAAALAIRGRAAHDPASRKLAAEDARTAALCLSRYLSVDGLLRGVAQENKGGPRLQHSRYRVIAQFGTGLLLQCLAECLGSAPHDG